MDWRVPPQQQIPARSESRKLPLDTVHEALSQPEEARLHRGLSRAADLMLSPATDSLEAPPKHHCCHPIPQWHSSSVLGHAAGGAVRIGARSSEALSCSARREPWWLSWQSGLFSVYSQKVMIWQCCSCCMVWERGCAATGKWVPGEPGGIGQ